jgi:quercetin dioxygenase-like cupin family protein
MTEKENHGGTPKVQRLVDLVNYQDGSIVSREIIHKSTGTVTLFAFDEGQGLSEHTAPFDALVYIVDGQVEVVLSGKPYHLNQGELIILPANETHALRALGQIQDAISYDKILSIITGASLHRHFLSEMLKIILMLWNTSVKGPFLSILSVYSISFTCEVASLKEETRKWQTR